MSDAMAPRDGMGNTIWNGHRLSKRHWITRGLLGIALIGVGAGGSWVYLRAAHTNSPQGSEAVDPHREHTMADPTPEGRDHSAHEEMQAPQPEVELTLSEHAVERAGIEIATVATRPIGRAIRIPGTVEPNAYRTVTVTPLVAGRVQRVQAQLGDRVRAGQTLATVFSPDLADAQTRYLSMTAALEAEHQRLQRTLRLIEIGAASQQELEEARARHTTHATDVEGARARLALLGLSHDRIASLSRPDQISAMVNVPAPVSGEVIAREANPGLVVDQSSMLFTVSDLSTVWVMGAVYERDFSALRLRSPVVVTTAAFPGFELQGRISYLAPRVDAQTRTAQVRVEVPNTAGRMRLGMYVDVRLGPADPQPAPVVPTEAVQTVGDRSVVYVVKPDQGGRFTEREVRVGERFDGVVSVLAGLQAGDNVVVKGSFALRAESERVGGSASKAHQNHGTQH